MAFMGHKESCGESKREPRYMAAPALIARATPSARLFEPNPVSYNPSSKARAKSSGLGACDAREALRTRASPAAFGASCERCCAVAIPTCRILCVSLCPFHRSPTATVGVGKARGRTRMFPVRLSPTGSL